MQEVKNEVARKASKSTAKRRLILSQSFLLLLDAGDEVINFPHF